MNGIRAANLERSRVRDSTLWLVRFDDTGQFLAKSQIEVDYFVYIRIAVFPSGSFLVVGYVSHPTLPGDPPADLEPFSGIFSREAGFVRRVELPDRVEWTHEIVALTASGTMKARIDVDEVLGAGMANIEDFARGRGNLCDLGPLKAKRPRGVTRKLLTAHA